jgi:hypothetical protein
MDDPMSVEVLDGTADLVDVTLDLKFSETLSSSDEFVKGLTGA